MGDELQKDKRNGMNIVELIDDIGNRREIVSNAYPGYAYFNEGVSDDLKKDA